MIECSRCDGDGFIYLYMDKITCPECDGDGEESPYKHYYDGVEGLEGYYD